jgi:hypothetical protein
MLYISRHTAATTAFPTVGSRQRDRVVLTMTSAAPGACRGHAVVDPTYATEKKRKKRHYEKHAAFSTTIRYCSTTVRYCSTTVRHCSTRQHAYPTDSMLFSTVSLPRGHLHLPDNYSKSNSQTLTPDFHKVTYEELKNARYQTLTALF